MISFDDIDRKILLELSRDADQNTGKLARKLGLSQPAIWRRVKN